MNIFHLAFVMVYAEKTVCTISDPFMGGRVSQYSL